MDLYALSILVLFLPLASASVLGIGLGHLHYRVAQIFSTACVAIAALLSWVILVHMYFDHQKIHIKIIEWFGSGTFRADWSIYLDMLSSLMLVVVTTVSALVHLYSIGYMDEDASKGRFMCYLSLFTFCMLVLILADNFAQLFVGWEGVGLSSYLLIGFWFKKDVACKAAMKAFIINRVGDIGLVLGIFLIAVKFSSIEYDVIFAQAKYLTGDVTNIGSLTLDTITLICFLLFVGCIGKSAQIGLHTWLPDAMEGPTPVSALIHAATMVTAGVFLLARTSYLFELSESALKIVTTVGAITCLAAAMIAVVQNDIKKIIAYSTCSQLGYMVFACGISAYSGAIFHLVTHAFFKALLFLSAGSVIHAIHGEQDINHMGGVWKKLPYTYIFFLIGSVAISGIPPFSGFFSKDIILEAAYASSIGKLAYWFGIVAATLTAYYSFRLVFLVFHGKSKLHDESMANVHEAPFSMMLPLVILSIGSIAVGLIAYHLGIVDFNSDFWHNSLFIADSHTALRDARTLEQWVKTLPVMVAILGIVGAFMFHLLKLPLPIWLFCVFKPLWNLLRNKLYFDLIYDVFVVKLARLSGGILWRVVDSLLIDGIPTLATKAVNRIGSIISSVQTGYVQHYAISMVIGVIILIYWYLSW